MVISGAISPPKLSLQAPRNVPYGLPRFAGFFAPWSDAVPRYVMDLFGGNRLLVSQAFDGSDDAEAVAKANVMFFGDAVSRPEITGYRLRNPFPGGDRIFHREDKRDYAEVKANGEITPSIAREALKLEGVDEQGLDDLDRSLLR